MYISYDLIIPSQGNKSLERYLMLVTGQRNCCDTCLPSSLLREKRTKGSIRKYTQLKMIFRFWYTYKIIAESCTYTVKRV